MVEKRNDCQHNHSPQKRYIHVQPLFCSGCSRVYVGQFKRISTLWFKVWVNFIEGLATKNILVLSSVNIYRFKVLRMTEVSFAL